jgi:Reverse transcriptase (RNA-dependent DNA polymerase)
MLNESIYGLKQSPEHGMTNSLISCNFKVSDTDSSLFIKNNTHKITVMLVYVDDIIITGDNQIEINYVKKDIK